MERYTFPTMSILVATAIGIATVATPVRAAPGFVTAVTGSACAAVKGHESKMAVQNNGALYNKSTSGTASINCPPPLEFNRATNVYVAFIKRDTSVLTCTYHRRSLNYLSGATTQTSTTVAGSGLLGPMSATSDYFNSVQCVIPAAAGAGTNQQNGVNGVVWTN